MSRGGRGKASLTGSIPATSARNPAGCELLFPDFLTRELSFGICLAQVAARLTAALLVRKAMGSLRLAPRPLPYSRGFAV
jgi:hypothetical protein